MNDAKIKNNIFKLLFVLLIATVFVAGSTYAALVLTLSVNVTNGVYNESIACFDINYNPGNDINGTLFPSSGYDGGLGDYVEIGISEECVVSAKGNLYLNIESVDSTLIQILNASCHNAETLKTIPGYENQNDCVSAGGVWDTLSALKYAVVDSSDNILNTGDITQTGSVNVYSDFNVNGTATRYYIYVWLDGELVDNSYAGLSFNATLDATVTQVESEVD